MYLSEPIPQQPCWHAWLSNWWLMSVHGLVPLTDHRNNLPWLSHGLISLHSSLHQNRSTLLCSVLFPKKSLFWKQKWLKIKSKSDLVILSTVCCEISISYKKVVGSGYSIKVLIELTSKFTQNLPVGEAMFYPFKIYL